jgi:hypothetical protein
MRARAGLAMKIAPSGRSRLMPSGEKSTMSRYCFSDERTAS